MTKISLVDSIGNLAVSKMPLEKKLRILKKASQMKSLEEEIAYILENIEG
jgi:hypothetical protein